MGCTNPKSHSGEEPLARVNKQYLYPSDLSVFIPNGLSETDSLDFIDTYIQQWIRRQLLLNQAEFNLDLEKADYSQMIADYRAYLLIHAYQKQLLLEKIDTVITQTEIEDYYTTNLTDFELSAPIVKALYVRINKENTKVKEIKDLLQSSSNQAFQNLVDLCYQYADRFDFFEDKWVSFKLIVQNIPGSPENHEAFLRSGSIMEIEDEQFIHFLQIHVYKLTGETAPIEYVNNRIRDMVIAERKLNYLKELEEDIFQDAADRNEFEVYHEN